MSDVTRRDAVKLAAAGAVLAVGATVAQAQDKKESAKGSGATRPQPAVKELRVKDGAAALTASGYVPLTPDADPGWNVATISLPAGTRVASAWATEDGGGASHAGGAYFNTVSVQLYDNGTKLRVRFQMEGWPTHLPSALMVVFA